MALSVPCRHQTQKGRALIQNRAHSPVSAVPSGGFVEQANSTARHKTAREEHAGKRMRHQEY